MSSGVYKIIKNKNWDNSKRPFITIITPVYNRRSTILRTMMSVEAQTFRNIEYIIIDDGSFETIDDIVKSFMDNVSIPIMFVKKHNGGVHTARNVGYVQARGELILCIDSDDELLPEACKVFHDTWLSIPKDDRAKCWQIKAQILGQNNKTMAPVFPENINNLPIGKARKYFSVVHGEQIGCRSAKIMKQNLFPEPNGITFVMESIIWIPLENKYRSWGINDIVSKCYRDGNDHLSDTWRKDKQSLKNGIWSRQYIINHPKDFRLNLTKNLKMITKYCIFLHLLSVYNEQVFIRRNKIIGFCNNFWKVIVWVPTWIIAKILRRNSIID